MPVRLLLLGASIAGTIGVILGALGAHALEDRLVAAGTLGAWGTAVDYLFWHILATLAAIALLGERAVWAGYCWMTGLILFSGSLFILSLGGPGWLGPITPLGGVFFIVGWLVFAVQVLRQPRINTE